MRREIKLYHGTIYDFNLVDLSKCKDAKDFGKGFYLTRDLEHAKSVARKGFMLSGFQSRQYVHSFKLDINKARTDLKVHEFQKVNYAWLDFIIRNRMLLLVEVYDVIIGPTADAKAQDLISDYFNKYGLNGTAAEKDKLLQDLKTHVFSIQYCFRSSDSLNYLNYLEGREIG